MNKFLYSTLVFFLFFGCKKKETNLPVVIGKPVIEISSLTTSEGEVDEIYLNVKLRGNLEESTLVEYEILAGTAKEGEDYEIVSGVLIFSSDESSHNQNIP